MPIEDLLKRGAERITDEQIEDALRRGEQEGPTHTPEEIDILVRRVLALHRARSHRPSEDPSPT